MTELRETQPNFRQYPLPLATYDEVVSNPKLFIDTLEKLHAKMGTKFMVPTIGGKELDLHRLFVEVTSRGGIDKIIKDRRWKDVTAVFSFPSTATNASFVLRKYYISLLHHYEQIYFFGARGWIPPPAASLPAPSSAHVPAQGTYELSGSVSETQVMSQKRRRSTGEFLPGGYPVVGVIDGKFEHGYLVTVTVGTQKLRGVLYHTSEHPPAAHLSHFPSATHNSIGDVAATSGVRRRRRRKKSEMRKRDPSHPKPNRSGYNFFFAEQHARLKPLHPGKDREISRMIGDLWNKLTETEKAVYQERGVKDKERYRSEMEEYRERLKAGPINAIPIQQRLVVPEASSTVDSDVKMEMEGGLAENESSSEESESEDDKILDDKITEVEVLPVGSVEMGGQSGSVSVEAVEFQQVDQGGKVGDVRISVGVEQSETIANEPSVVAPMELVENEPLPGGPSESVENVQSNMDEQH
ncbi:hypothetical protein H6P81_012572 [Aristolochia fimbriata]|uniref:High mobility group B protein 15-like n=1 Tax=Aristolochia fimbriata TaxID=158543 RepID=A0AAV7ECS1_ARIFI|nr:hypothetical protein H6P81_012572 [Aristolochia fimbriata]